MDRPVSQTTHLYWVDVTGIPSGEYWLETEVDPAEHVLEDDETNNIVRLKVTLTIPDDDADGLVESVELAFGTDPSNPDTDGDALWDGDGDEVGFDGDADAYDLYNPIDNVTGVDTDALAWDTDGDGNSDGVEVALGQNPLNAADGGSLPVATPLGILILGAIISFMLMRAHPSS